MDPKVDWPIIQPAVIEDDEIIEEAIKEKSTSTYIYEKWWRSSAVCIFIILLVLSNYK